MRPICDGLSSVSVNRMPYYTVGRREGEKGGRSRGHVAQPL